MLKEILKKFAVPDDIIQEIGNYVENSPNLIEKFTMSVMYLKQYAAYLNLPDSLGMAVGLFIAGFVIGGGVVRFMTLRGIRPFNDAKTYVIESESTAKPRKSILRDRAGSISKLGGAKVRHESPARLSGINAIKRASSGLEMVQIHSTVATPPTDLL